MEREVSLALADLLEMYGRRFRYGADLGCGTGNYGDLLKEYVDWLVGVDHNRERLSYAIKNGYDEVVVADVREFQIPPECDVVFMFDVIEHLPKQDGLMLLQRALPGRSVFLTTPSKFFGFAMKNGHQSLWTVEELANLGFQEIYLVPVGFPKSMVYGDKILAIKL